MIITKIVKIKKSEEIVCENIESFFKSEGLDILRWAITSSDNDFFYVCIAFNCY